MNSKLARLKEILWVFALFGLVAIVLRIVNGLGATTALSDEMPWGLWKIVNMIAGVALATGGFIIACAVYVFQLKKYKPVLRLAVLAAFLGYGSSCFALLWDIGLPHLFWHPFIFWNHHSFLFEVFWCVMLYFSVTTLEFAPIIIEKYKLEKPVHLFHKITIALVIIGITLSSMHHTSLGSLFLMAPSRLHPLWYTMWLPIHFIITAIGAGIMTVVFLYLMYCYFYQKKENLTMLTGLVKGSAVILAIALLLRIVDFTRLSNWQHLFAGTWESYIFSVEMILSFIIPIALVIHQRLKATVSGLFIMSLSAMAGMVLNRANVGILGFLRTATVPYVPTLSEIALSLGIVAMAGLAFFYMVEKYKVLEGLEDKLTKELREKALLTDRISKSWQHGVMTPVSRISFIAVIIIPLSVLLFSTGSAVEGFNAIKSPVKPPKAVDKKREILNINADTDEDYVKFPHAQHMKRNQDNCQICHHINLPKDQASSCYHCHQDLHQKTSIFNHLSHQKNLKNNDSCKDCHDLDLPKNKNNSKACVNCHAKNKDYDMGMVKPKKGKANDIADSYKDAMHNQCITCHEKEAKVKNNKTMTKCLYCHQHGSD